MTTPSIEPARHGVHSSGLPSSGPVAVCWRNVSVALDGRPVLRQIDLDVAAGEWVSLIGPNGAGKTTLVRTLGGTVAHDGEIRLGDEPVTRLKDRRRASLLAVVPQHPVVPPGIDVFNYALLGRSPHQGLRLSPSLDDRRRVFAVLQRLELDGLADRGITTLSGGERQRVVLARALAQDTPVLVLDEPTAFLDVGHQLEVLELIADLRLERSLTVITTLHDLSVAGQFADRVAVLYEGELVALGTPTEVITPATIDRYWGAEATVAPDDHGGVTVTIVRRRESRSSGPVRRQD